MCSCVCGVCGSRVYMRGVFVVSGVCSAHGAFAVCVEKETKKYEE